MTDEEIVLRKALEFLKQVVERKRLRTPRLGDIWKVITVPSNARSYLERMELDRPRTIKQRLLQRAASRAPRLAKREANDGNRTRCVLTGVVRNEFTDNYGIAFDLLWIKPVPGDYFVVTMESPDLGEQKVLLVFDSPSFPGGQTSVAINCDKSGSALSMVAKGNLIGQVSLANFRFVVVGSASGFLHSRRLAAAAEKSA